VSLSGLAQISIELSSTCDKTHLCTFCGHQDENINPNLQFGHMALPLLQSIRAQLEPGVVVSFHRDGESTTHPRLRECLSLFHGFTTSLVTHGLNLARRADELIENCTTITVSAFRGDADRDAQYESVSAFLKRKGDRLPRVQLKIVGDGCDERLLTLGVPVLRRLIHTPSGNTKYAHRLPTVPECGICLDALHRPSVDWRGRVFLCNRLDTTDAGFLGDLNQETLEAIWNGQKRQASVKLHQQGHRHLVNSLCASCTFYGVPSEWQPPVAAETVSHPTPLIQIGVR